MRQRRLQDIGDKRIRQIHATVFGTFRLKDKDGQKIIITNRRAQAILAMPCLMPNEPLEREFVSHLLWPRRFKAQAKARLRQCLLRACPDSAQLPQYFHASYDHPNAASCACLTQSAICL